MSRPRRVAIVLATRGNYAKMKSTMRAIKARNDLELVTFVGGGIIQERFGDYRPIIAGDGFVVDAEIDFLTEEGTTLEAQTQSAGTAVIAVGRALATWRPDIVLIVADRWESLAIALAATCMNIPIAHLEGGEISGSIDDRIRHAITKLSHLHFPANRTAAERIIRMGEDSASVVIVGTPSLDLLTEIDLANRQRPSLAPGGEGDLIDLNKPYIVVSQHSVVTHVETTEDDIAETAAAVANAGRPIVWLLPNMDAGGGAVRGVIERTRRQNGNLSLRLYPSMTFEYYSILLANADCLIGNSSSGIREAAFLGTPVVNIGDRQLGRERGHNVIDVPCEREAIGEAIRRQFRHGRYTSDPLYGDGRSGERIAEALTSCPLRPDKTANV